MVKIVRVFLLYPIISLCALYLFSNGQLFPGCVLLFVILYDAITQEWKITKQKE